MDRPSFARARNPQQRRERLTNLTAVTRTLLQQYRATSVTLGQIADAAGLAKSGVLRYAGSREALLLQVMHEEHIDWLAELDVHEPRDMAGELARTLAQRPVLCDLIAASPALMSRLTPQDSATVRAQARDIQERLALVLAPHLALDRRQIILLTAAIHAFAGTAWAWAATDYGQHPVFAGDVEATIAGLLHTFIAGLRSR